MGIELYALDPTARGIWWDVVRGVRDDQIELDQESGVQLVRSAIPLQARAGMTVCPPAPGSSRPTRLGESHVTPPSMKADAQTSADPRR